VNPGKLRSVLGITDVNYTEGNHCWQLLMTDWVNPATSRI
jgi:hypothetical protein